MALTSARPSSAPRATFPSDGRAVETASGPAASPPAVPAGWGRRVAAAMVDLLILYALQIPVFAAIVLALGASEVLAIVVGVLGVFALIGFAVVQRVRQGRTGATIGKDLLGLRLIGEHTGRPIGVVASLVRPFVHLLDSFPLYGGWLWPLVDSKRQTFADKAMRTLVIRTAPQRAGRFVPAVAFALAVLLSVGPAVALARSDRSADLAAVTAATTDTAAGDTAAGVPPVAPQVGPLPPEALEGRIGPVASGYTAVPDDITELGPLSVEQAAELGSASPEGASEAAEGLRLLGMQEGFGRGFDTEDNVYTVVVYRFADTAAATELVAQATGSLDKRLPTEVPGAVAFDLPAGEDVTAIAGLFAKGLHAYEVTLLGEPGSFSQADLEALLRAQYDHATLTG